MVSIRRHLRARLASFLLAAGIALPAAASDIFVRDGDAPVLTNLPADDDYRLLLASPAEGGGAPAPTATPPRVAGSESYRQWLHEAATISGVDARLLQAVAAVESGFRAEARSNKGALGLMQLIPATARRYGVADPFDPRQNIMGGARYLADLLRMFGNDTAIALAAYNAGEQAVIRHGGRIPPYRETQDYVPRVLRLYQALGGRQI